MIITSIIFIMYIFIMLVWCNNLPADFILLEKRCNILHR